jgi:hypothetical protein
MEYNIEINLTAKSAKVWIGLNQFRIGTIGAFIEHYVFHRHF